MPSTYSSRLRFELVPTGEQTGTWGDTANVNLGTLVEEAIAGQGSIAMTTGDYTLSTANGATDEARKAILALSGSIGAARDLIVPAISKIYVVYNGTTGGFAVTVKVSGSTGVSIANGERKIVYCDGAEVYSFSATSSGGLTMAARQTANFDAVAGNIYPSDTTSGAFTATLPASPAQGDRIGFTDVGGAWNANNLTVGRNGNNIIGAASDLVCNVQHQVVVLAWDATRGWRFAA